MEEAFKSKDFVKSLARGLSIIRAFDADSPEMTLSEVAETAGMTRAGARRFLLTLASLGYVAKDGRKFRLTPKILTLGYAYMSSLPLAELAQPFLDEVTRNTGESSSMAVLDRFDIAYITRSRAKRLLMVGVHVGTRLPTCTTSMGRILLSSLDDAALARYLDELHIERYTARTITDKAALRTEIELARKQDYYVLDQELEIGLRSIAVPVLGPGQGKAVAAINIATNASTVSKKRLLGEFLPILRQAAAGIRGTIV
jgi:IclR family transcriptional regulator, pca regulon regulatory protein